MCNKLGVATPPWALIAGGSRCTVVSDLRNNALHEALFVGEPFGFKINGGNTVKNVTLEMKALVCRLLVALLGGKDPTYLQSPVNTRRRNGLRLI